LAQEIISSRDENRPNKKRVEKLLTELKTGYDCLYPIQTKFASIFEKQATSVHKIVPISSLTDSELQRRDVLVVAEVLKINDRNKNDAYNLQKRNGKVIIGETQYLSLNVADDTGSIYVNISPSKYKDLAGEIISRGLTGRPCYGFNATIGPGFRILHLNSYKYLGQLDDQKEKIEPPPATATEAVALESGPEGTIK
jgi:hypothetical protein